MTAGSVAAPQIIPIRVPSPGKVKHVIDSNTPIEIKSESSDVIVMYTLDGRKPEMMERPKFDSSTLKYTQPFRLPAGKVSVKAMAVAGDGRQSSIVTKIFTVEQIPGDEQNLTKDNEDDSLMTNNKDVDGKRPRASSAKYLDIPRSSKGPRFLSKRRDNAFSAELPTHGGYIKSLSGLVDSALKSTTTVVPHLQSETDFLRCQKCQNHRPSDPFARHCQHCGATVAPIPGQRLPPTAGGQVDTCFNCKTLVPLNADRCVVCESPLPQQLQTSQKLQGKIICHACGTGNPLHISNCVTCETRLLQRSTTEFRGQRVASAPTSAGKIISCSKCNRSNHPDARFCDWCGEKKSRVKMSSVTCSKCGASNHPYAKYCGNCAVFLEGPTRTFSKENQDTLDQSPAGLQEVMSHEPSAPPPPPADRRTYADAQTQTIGLFFLSSAALKIKSQKKVQELSRQKKIRDRKSSFLTAISPGGGFWRKQLDHVCAHLRSYTQNNTEFRSLIGEPRMGRMISAVVQEDRYEVSLLISFMSSSPKRSRGSSAQSRSVASANQNLSAVTEGRSSVSLESQINKSDCSSERRTQKVWGPGTTEEMPESESKDHLLLQELNPEGQGRVSVVQQLIDEGADPECLGGDGRPALVAAVLNGHHDVIPVLVQRDADVNLGSGLLNNTALHEAASLGNEGLKSVEILLGCNANVRKQNDLRETPYDLAVASGSSVVISLLETHTANHLLELYGSKTRRLTGLDTFS